MTTARRRFAKLYVPTLAMALVVLYLALARVQPSTAEMMPAAMTFQAAQPVNQEDMAAAHAVLIERLSSSDSHSSAELSLAIEGSRLAVSLPPGVEPSIVVAEAGRVGQVELVDGGTEFLTVSSVVKTGYRAIPDQDVHLAVLTSADFEAAEAQLNDQGRPVIEFALTPSGDARLAAHTAELRGYYICMAVDGRVVNCPILRTPLTNRRGTIELTGDASLDDARTLAMLIRSGPLPVPFELSDK